MYSICYVRATSLAPITNLKKSLHFFIKNFFKVFLFVLKMSSALFLGQVLLKFFDDYKNIFIYRRLFRTSILLQQARIQNRVKKILSYNNEWYLEIYLALCDYHKTKHQIIIWAFLETQPSTY